MLAALPVEMAAIHRVTLQTRFIRLGRTPLSRIAHISLAGGLGARFRVLLAVCVAGFTLCTARVFEKFRALAVRVQGERLHDERVTLAAVPPNHRLLRGLFDRLRLNGRSTRPRKSKEDDR